ncbi:MAG: hypothetical protein N2578_04245, partial [Bdellovibrionaceae bacterium]|nr:hypothetical protein [Pseudobdellovibrionaceae bacterium]
SQRAREFAWLLGKTSRRQNFRVRTKSNWLVAVRLLGGMMGERLYHGFTQGHLSRSTLVNLLRKSPEEPRFTNVYREILEIVEGLPQGFFSKLDKL